MSCPIDIKPFSQSENLKKPNIFNLNYTNQDFNSMKTRLVDFIRERFGTTGTVIPNTFNDFIESDVGIMLIENWAFLADTLSFKMDQIVNELFIDTVTEVENAFRLCKLFGFMPTPPIAARSKWIVQLNNVFNTDVLIDTPYRIDIPSPDRPTSIELFAADSNFMPLFDEQIIIPAGQKFNKSIVGIEGKTIEEEFSGNGQVAQTATLSFLPVIYNSIRVEVDGNMWNQVDYFTDSQPRREYRVEYNSNYQAFVMFGNNRTGLIPSNGSRIRITYRIGGGLSGNIVTGFVETQGQVLVNGLDFTVPVTYRNYSKGEFGYAGDGIDDIRRNLPKWIKAQDRAVTGEDYKTLTDQFKTPYSGQIGKSTAVLRNHGCSGNIVDLYILAKDGEDLVLANNELKVSLNQELNIKKMLTDFVCIKDGNIKLVDVNIDLTLDKFYKKTEKEIRANITRKINSFFSLNNWDYNQNLKSSDLIKELSDVKEIENIQIMLITSDESSDVLISSKFNEIIRPDIVTLSFIYN